MLTNKAKQVANEIYNLLLRGRQSYQSYLKNGRSFLYAKILKNNNEALHSYLLKYMHLFPQDLSSASLDLINHIDVWSVLWEQLALETKPSLEDEFVFENSVNYPKHFDLLIEEYLRN